MAVTVGYVTKDTCIVSCIDQIPFWGKIQNVSIIAKVQLEVKQPHTRIFYL